MAEEKNFENRVKKYLRDKGAWVLKYWAGAAYTKTGVPDLLVCYKGYFIALELKSTHGRLSDIQKYTLEQIRAAGGHAMVLYPKDFDSFKEFLNSI